METIKQKEVKSVLVGRWTMDGAGVRLKRMFGSPATVQATDPFLLLDNFGSDTPKDYEAGFPWHPHRGIETVTYLLEGKVKHEDSVGNSGYIYPGYAQWMTSGSGIFHQEMPQGIRANDPEDILKSTGFPDLVSGLQLWINIPAEEKMKNPVYRDIKKNQIPITGDQSGNRIRVIAGTFEDTTGEHQFSAKVAPRYLDVSMAREATLHIPESAGRTSMVFVIGGSVKVGSHEQAIGTGSLCILSDAGDQIQLESSTEGARIIMFSGKKLGESVAWHGPIVMNTQEQLVEAIQDLRNGTFVRSREPVFL